MNKNMNKNETLWLPNGYGSGTIIYDIENNPYEALGKIGAGNIHEIVPVSKEYALKRIEQNADKLVSVKEIVKHFRKDFKIH